VILALSAALSLAAAAAPAPAATPTPTPQRNVVDRVAATVNGDVITLQDLVDAGGPEYRRADAQPQGPERDKARAEALRRAFDALVADKLIEGQAAQLQIDVTDQMLDASIEDVKKANHFDDRQLDQALAAEGVSREQYRALMKKRLLTMSVLQQKVRSRLNVSDDDVRNYYNAHASEFAGEEERHVRHIYLSLPEGASAAEEARTRAEMQRIVQRLATGEDFAKVARDVSKGPSAQDGGDLGWVRHGTLQRALEEAIFSAKPGELTSVVRAGPGLHLFKVDERRETAAKPFEEVKDALRDRLTNEQAETYRQQYVDELRKDAAIAVNIPELKGAETVQGLPPAGAK
jgi:peptidyl-prolyl cis-trans isomerase SurA